MPWNAPVYWPSTSDLLILTCTRFFVLLHKHTVDDITSLYCKCCKPCVVQTWKLAIISTTAASVLLGIAFAIQQQMLVGFLIRERKRYESQLEWPDFMHRFSQLRSVFFTYVMTTCTHTCCRYVHLQGCLIRLLFIACPLSATIRFCAELSLPPVTVTPSTLSLRQTTTCPLLVFHLLPSLQSVWSSQLALSACFWTSCMLVSPTPSLSFSSAQ